MAGKPKKRTRLKADDFSIPKPISEDCLAELFARFKIRPKDRDNFRRMLEFLIDELTSWLSEEKQKPHRSADLDHMKAVQENLAEATMHVKRIGPRGRNALKSSANDLAPMLAAQWLSNKFPGDPYAPTPWRRSAGLVSRTASEEPDLPSRHQFIQRRPNETFAAVFGAMEKGLAAALRAFALQPGAMGGRKPLNFREWLLVNLAEIAAAYGLPISSGPRSEFVSFCEAVVLYIGWPTDGIDSAVPKALLKWRNLPGKRR